MTDSFCINIPPTHEKKTKYFLMLFDKNKIMEFFSSKKDTFVS